MSSPFEGVLKRAQQRGSGTSPGEAPAGTRPLRDIRRSVFMSIAELAERSSVSTKTIVEIELGRSLPRFKTIKKLSAALSVQPNQVSEFVAAAESDDGLRSKLAA